MAYRDEHEALRARLEATEQRLRVAETELEDAKRRLEAPLLMPSSSSPSSRRVGFPPVESHRAQYGRMAAASGGTLLSLVGIASLLWNLPAAEGLGDLAATVAFAIAFCLAPGGLLLYVSARRPRRAGIVSGGAEAPRARISSRARVHDLASHAAAEDLAEDDAEPPPSLHRKLTR